MSNPIPYLVVPDAVPALLDYCQEHALKRFFLIVDENTYRVLGQRVESALVEHGLDVKTILLTGPEIVTNEYNLVRTFVETQGEDRTYIAVGSGTVTDITRFVSHRSREKFISLPTAPSVDGYTSIVAPMEVGKYKIPCPAQPPVAVIADLPTLCAAPRPMIAAGLGDLLGKYTSLADWKIGSLLYDEPYDEHIAQKMREAVDATVRLIDSLAAGECEGIKCLMDGLIGTGFGMLEFGESRPASGSEHHLGHYWEMKFILEGRPAQLHGAEVSVGTILSARRYELLRKMTKADAAACLENRSLPTRESLLAEIQAAYSSVSDKIAAIQAPLLEMTQNDLDRLKARILEHWDAIQAAAQTVPSADQIISWISAVDGSTKPQDINLDQAETILSLKTAHYLRDRFTLNRLAFWLDLPLGYP